MRAPCDEAVIDSQIALSKCRADKRVWILAATILGSSMAFIDGTVVNVALPALQHDFGASLVEVQWVVEAYGLTLAALILVGGSMGDLFGRRRVFVYGVTLFAAASVGCGLAANIYHIIAARAVQGIGAAFLVPGSLAIISASFDEGDRGRAIGTWSGSTAITMAIGPVLGGWLIEHLSWRWAFFINLPLAILVIAISLWQVPESKSSRAGRIDWWGALSGTVALTALVFGCTESSRLGWRHPLILGTLVGGIVASAAFVWVEARCPEPMVPFSLFHSRAFTGANLLTLLLYSAIGIAFFLLPMNFIEVQGYSATAAGAALLPVILLMFLLSRWSGGLVDRYGARLPLTVGPAIVALGFVLISRPSVGGAYWTTFFPAVVVLGFGMSVSVAPLTTVVMNAIDQNRVGIASGINNAVARIAGLMAVAVFGAVMVAEFSNYMNHQLAQEALNPAVRAELRANEAMMAAMQVPKGVDAPTAAAIESSKQEAFVFGFRVVMWICAALALGSAGIARLTIPGKKPKSG